MSLKIKTWIVVSVATFSSAFYLLHLKPHEHRVELPELAVGHPWKESLEQKKEYVAQIKAIQHIELRSYEKGYLQHIYVDEGQFVEKGQKMFQLMPNVIQAEYDEALAEIKMAEIKYSNTQQLQEKNVVSDNELALAKAKLDKATAKMKLAQAHLNFTLIEAPFSGIMDRFQVRLGSLVEEGELLTSLSDNSHVWVYFNVSESDYLDYMTHKEDNKSTAVELMLANGSVYPELGKIDTIEADFNNETGNIAFRASFPNPKHLLRHGQTGTILLKSITQDALVIPQKASFEVLDKRYVYVIDKHNIVQTRPVQISSEVHHLLSIQSGLSPEDIILLEGVLKVRAGQKIKGKLYSTEEINRSLNLPVK